MMAKGKFKKKRWGFQPGHQPYVVERSSAEREKRSYVRPNGLLQLQDGNERENCAFLRPKSTESLVDRFAKMNLPDAERQSYRIMQMERVAELFGRSYSEHRTQSPNCSKFLQWDFAREKQRGLVWIESLKCTSCGYESTPEKLYTEVDVPGQRGRRAAQPNLGIHVGLSHTELSVTGLSHLLNSINIPSPSFSAMQSAANKVGTLLVEENCTSMRRLRASVNEVAGEKLKLSMDGRYNNPPRTAAGNTPFQAATQVVHLTAEDNTKERLILDVNCGNKLCHRGQLLAQGGFAPCPNHDGCTANLELDAPIGNETEMATRAILNLTQSGMQPSQICTDGDTSAATAANILFENGRIPHLPTIQLDTRHFSRSQRRYIQRAKFSAAVFPGRTATAKKWFLHRLADDLPSRCHAEHVAAVEQFRGHPEELTRAMEQTRRAITTCYTAKHEECKLHSRVCAGEVDNNWLKCSQYLTPGFAMSLSCEADRRMMEACVEFRLGEAAIEKVSGLANTQKVEAVNSALAHTVPKHKTYSRNFTGRVHSAVSAVNMGIGNSIVSQCQYIGAGIVPSSRVAKQLRARQRWVTQTKSPAANLKRKYRRLAKRKILFTTYAERRNLNEKPPYQQDIMMTSIIESANRVARPNSSTSD